MYVQHNIAARSSNHCCSEKAIRITYSEYVFTDSVIKHAKSMRRFILSSAARLAQPHFSTLSKKGTIFGKMLLIFCVFYEDIWTLRTKYPCTASYCITRLFMIVTLHQILFGLSNQGQLDGQSTRYIRGSRESMQDFSGKSWKRTFRTPKRRWEDNKKRILKKSDQMACSGLVWLMIGSSSGLL